MKVKGTYTVKKWEENVYNQISPEMKMTKASVEYTLIGDINGQANVEYLMFYKYFDSRDPHKSSAIYLGFIRFIGNVHGKDGSFMIEDHGAFENGLQIQFCRLWIIQAHRNLNTFMEPAVIVLIKMVLLSNWIII